MPLTAQNILTRAGDILHDATGVRWDSAELLRYLNDGRRELCVYRPDLYAVLASVVLVAGVTQSIPSDGHRFFEALYVETPLGAPFKAVHVIERAVLDLTDPMWVAKQQTPYPRHFMYDERQPRAFMVDPPAAAGARLRIRYAQTPADVTADASLTVEQLYENALLDYVLFRAFSKDSDFAGNMARSEGHKAAFQALAQAGATIGVVTGPNSFNKDGVPPRGTTQ